MFFSVLYKDSKICLKIGDKSTASFDIFIKFVDVKCCEMIRVFKHIVLSALVVGLFACGGSRRRASADANAQEAAQRYEFNLPSVPPALHGKVARDYLREHMWDNFDFGDTLQLPHLDKKQLTRAYAIYVEVVACVEAEEYLGGLMRRASTSKPMFDYFLQLAELVLHDPNSPMRDAEKYIAILEVVLASDLIDEEEKMPYAHDLLMAQKNRVGHRANDFRYTTADGRSHNLWSLSADYTLLFISNPDCAMCREMKEQMMDSALLDEKILQGELEVLVIYPDEDLTLWREHLGDYPAEWINGYDRSCSITHEELYDLRAIPSLYLLDRDKRVLAKDCTNLYYIEKLISEMQ